MTSICLDLLLRWQKERSWVRLEKKKKELYEQLLCTIAENHNSLRKKELTLFAGCQEIKYNGDLMIVGRALNGWTNNWAPSQAGDLGYGQHKVMW